MTPSTGVCEGGIQIVWPALLEVEKFLYTGKVMKEYLHNDVQIYCLPSFNNIIKRTYLKGIYSGGHILVGILTLLFVPKPCCKENMYYVITFSS